MTFLAAAETILRAATRPLTTEEIVQIAMHRGLLKTRGKTPSKTLTAKLYCLVRADPDGPIRREYQPGNSRAARGSVRWTYAANAAQGRN